MRMAELSERSGVAIPTIRYYLREGLLEPGVSTSPNQATYGEGHVRRLALVRALVEVGGMPIARVSALFAHLRECADTGEDEEVTLGLVQYALVRDRAPEATPPAPDAAARVDELLDRVGWRVRPQHPARAVLATTLDRLAALGQDDVLSLLDRYADLAHELAEAEVDVVLARGGTDQRAEGVVVVDVLGDAAFSALRSLAQEDLVSRRLAAPAHRRRSARR